VSIRPRAGQPTGPLLSQDDLASWLTSAEPPVLLDVRWRMGGPPGIETYLAGHLPGACFVDLDRDLAGPPGKAGRHPLPDPADLQTALRNAGLHAGQPVVVYDDGDSTIAARLWWMLRYYGHSPVAVLDGGYRAWATAGLPVTSAVPRPEPGDFRVCATGGMPVLDAGAAARLGRSGVLLDARAGERYRGEAEPLDPVAGHVPGAISAPTLGNVGEDGKFLSKPELAARFAALGVPVSAEFATGPAGNPLVGAYCGSGVTAAHEVLALELIGVPAALYVGSWSAWSADPSRPVATGAERG